MHGLCVCVSPPCVTLCHGRHFVESLDAAMDRDGVLRGVSPKGWKSGMFARPRRLEVRDHLWLSTSCDSHLLLFLNQLQCPAVAGLIREEAGEA